jgi:hypothetical protein
LPHPLGPRARQRRVEKMLLETCEADCVTSPEPNYSRDLGRDEIMKIIESDAKPYRRS